LQYAKSTFDVCDDLLNTVREVLGEFTEADPNGQPLADLIKLIENRKLDA